MSKLAPKPRFISFHRLSKLSRRGRANLLLQMLSGQLQPDALLEVGGRTQPLFIPQRAAELSLFSVRHLLPHAPAFKAQKKQ